MSTKPSTWDAVKPSVVLLIEHASDPVQGTVQVRRDAQLDLGGFPEILPDRVIEGNRPHLAGECVRQT